jgi:hypothetical protein
MGEAEEKALNWDTDNAEEIGSKWGLQAARAGQAEALPGRCAELHRLQGVFLTANLCRGKRDQGFILRSHSESQRSRSPFLLEKKRKEKTRRSNLRRIRPPQKRAGIGGTALKGGKGRRMWIPTTSSVISCSSPAFRSRIRRLERAGKGGGDRAQCAQI